LPFGTSGTVDADFEEPAARLLHICEDDFAAHTVHLHSLRIPEQPPAYKHVEMVDQSAEENARPETRRDLEQRQPPRAEDPEEFGCVPAAVFLGGVREDGPERVVDGELFPLLLLPVELHRDTARIILATPRRNNRN